MESFYIHLVEKRIGPLWVVMQNWSHLPYLLKYFFVASFLNNIITIIMHPFLNLHDTKDMWNNSFFQLNICLS